MTNQKQSTSAALLICSLTAAAILGFAAKETDPLAPVQASRSFKAEDGSGVAFVGACRATPDTISCWNADGKSDPDLVEKIKAYYIVQSSSDLTFKFGRKNRLLVFERPRDPQGRFSSVGSPKVNDQYAQEAGQLGNYGSGSGPNIAWYRVDTDPAASTVSAEFDFNINIGSGMIELKEGAEAQIGPLHLKITSIKKGPDVPTWIDGKQAHRSTWKVVTVISGYPQAHVPNLSGQLFDAKGSMIAHTDASGKPAVLKPATSQYGQQYWPGNQGLDASINTGAGAGTLNQELTLTVDPSKVEKAQLNASGVRKVTLTDLGLDPK